MSDPTPPKVVVPLIPSPPPPPAPPPPAPTGMRVWYLLQGTTLLGLFFMLLGTGGFIVYMTSDKAHLHETVFLMVAIGLIAFGAHLISRQSVKAFLADFARFIPWGATNGKTEERSGRSGADTESTKRCDGPDVPGPRPGGE